MCVFQYLSTYLSTKTDIAITNDLIYSKISLEFMKAIEKLEQNVEHITNQNDVIISTLVKILGAIDDKQIEAIKIRLEEQIIQN